jgi:hypothetical protein
VTVFSFLTSKPVTIVFSSLVSKLVAMVSPGLASKLAVSFLVEPQNQGGGGFSGLDLKISSDGFGDLDIKITATVSWFEAQNQARFDLSVAPQNRQREIGMRHTLRSSGLLGVEVSLARVSQSDLKTGGCTTTDGARGTITDVA